MRILVFGALVGLLGCGSVTADRLTGDGATDVDEKQDSALAKQDAGLDATPCVPSTCQTCVGGVAVSRPDGFACGTAGADGGMSPSCNGLIGTDYRCQAGACIQSQNVDCSTFKCPNACEVPGCFTYTSDPSMQQTTAACLCSVTLACPQ